MVDAEAVVQDPDRVAAVRRLVLLDSPPTERFDRLTRLASGRLHTPIALLTLVDRDRQFFVSSCGLSDPIKAARQTPLDFSICQYAVAARQPFVIEDARANRVLAHHPAVTELGVVSYAGIPLITAEGHAVGTLCVLDRVARHWTDEEIAALTDLAEIARDEIRLHFADRLAMRRREWRAVAHPAHRTSSDGP
jgi:GAF domain-containing protein